MPCALILLPGISKSDDQPCFAVTEEHFSEQVSNGGAAVDMVDSAGENRRYIQLLDLAAGAVFGQGDGVVDDQFLNDTVVDPLESGTGQNTVRCAGVASLAPPTSTRALAALHREPAVSTISS